MEIGTLDVGFIDIINIFKGTNELSEGEAIVKAKGILTCGYTFKNDSLINITAYCLQSPDCHYKHRITVDISLSKEKKKSISYTCNCKAEEDPRWCKHIAAVLIHIWRIRVSRLNRLTREKLNIDAGETTKSFDNRKLSWRRCSTIKIPRKIPHVKISEEQAEKFRQILFSACPESEAAIHYSGKRNTMSKYLSNNIQPITEN